MLAKVIRATGAAHIGDAGDAVRYVARDRPDQAGEPRPEMWVHGFDCPLDSRADRETAIDIMRAQMAASGRQPKPYHVVLTWQSGEHPTRAQAERAAEHVMDRLGYAGCPAVAAMHRDTDNDHLHLVVCRVDESGRIHAVPHHDYLILDRAMREIEIAQGWARSQGPWITLDTQEGPQIVRMSRRERRARGLLKDRGEQPGPGPETVQIETATGDLSYQTWVAGAPAEALHAAVDKPGATWRDAHEALAKYGVRIERKGSGLIVTTTVPGANGTPRVLGAKASQLGRWASKSALEQRLGEFTPPADPLPPPVSGQTYAEAVAAQRVDLEGESPPHSEESERTDGRKTGAESGRQDQQRGHGRSDQQQSHGSREQHQRSARDTEERTRRRAERQAERDALAARFNADEAERRAEARRRREALRAKHAAERRALTERLRTERQTARAELRAQGIDRRTADSLFAFKAAAEREQMVKRQRDERQALSAELSRGMVWRRWVESQAAAGDEAAQAALRGIRYREQRRRHAETNGIEGDPVDPLAALHEKLRRGPEDLVLATLSAERDRLGRHITYRRTATGTTAFVDRGPRIDMVLRDDPSLEAALRIASQKYGGQVLLTGSAEFQERAAKMATRLGIRVTNPDLQGIVRDARAVQQPYDHRAWAAASQRVREERERERRAAEGRRDAAAQARWDSEQPSGEAGSAIPPPLNDSPATNQAGQTPPCARIPEDSPEPERQRSHRTPSRGGGGIDEGR